jgi:hypothetical protein
MAKALLATVVKRENARALVPPPCLREPILEILLGQD